MLNEADKRHVSCENSEIVIYQTGNPTAYSCIATMGVCKVRFTSSLLTSSFPCVPFLVGLPGSDVLSLTSDMLGLLPSLPLFPRWLNWTLRRDLAITVVGRSTESDDAVFWLDCSGYLEPASFSE